MNFVVVVVIVVVVVFSFFPPFSLIFRIFSSFILLNGLLSEH